MRWRACAFIKFQLPVEYPEMVPPGRPTHALMTTDWEEEVENVRGRMWNMRAACESHRWVFWVEPEDMTSDVADQYVPFEVRDFLPYYPNSSVPSEP